MMRVGILKNKLQMMSYTALFRNGSLLEPWQVALINNMANPLDRDEIRLKSYGDTIKMQENREKFKKVLVEDLVNERKR